MEFKKHINNSKINKYDATINTMFVNNTTVIFYDSPINYGGFSKKNREHQRWICRVF